MQLKILIVMVKLLTGLDSQPQPVESELCFALKRLNSSLAGSFGGWPVFLTIRPGDDE